MVGGKQYIAMTGYGALIAYALAPNGGNTLQTAFSKADVKDALPDGPGKDVSLRVCTSCHAAQLWSGSRLSQAAWEDTIKRMIDRGLAITRDDYKTVLDYLSNNLSALRGLES
jgi:cytochrome c5